MAQDKPPADSPKAPEKEKRFPSNISTIEGVRAIASEMFITKPEDRDKPLSYNAISLLEMGVPLGDFDYKNRIRFVPYTFEILNPPRPLNAKTTSNPELLTAEERELFREQIRLLERKSNARVKFVEITAEEAKEKSVYIPILKADTVDGTAPAEETDKRMGGFTQGKTLKPAVILDKVHGLNAWVMQHEFLHALGFSHPWAKIEEAQMAPTDPNRSKAGGDNPEFNKDHTALSYNKGSIEAPGYGRDEITGVRIAYGVKPGADPETVHIDDLVSARTLVATSGATLDLRNTGEYTGRLEFRREGIFGNLTPPNGKRDEVGAYYIDQAKLKNISASGSSVEIAALGNELVNRLEGGKGSDMLVARGGGDTLIGNEGKDWFYIDGVSGFNNVIADYTPGTDRLEVNRYNYFSEDPPKYVSKIDFTYREDVLVDGKPTKGTRITGSDYADKPVSSAFLIGVKPEDLMSDFKDSHIKITLSEDPTEKPQVPTGIPTSPPKSDKSKGK